ncbi:GH32 C-terminal domain-containing protein [Corynebacterium auriscanis]|uniref:GH32 C-terminal domain-containing protein n=1 Tax=Corynebacterium auriscanis TaxID=99807 RepID=UPI0024AE308C|nr:GH32 C-terminal domain-containing protein [Corynebacterium auriscanis]
MENSLRLNRPELHITAETGVLEAPAGAIFADGAIHVFHQFRPTPTSGAKWAHQVASSVAYDWDVCDDVLAPEGDEIDILAGSSVGTDEGVELFFVSTTADQGEATGRGELLGSEIDHGDKGARQFQIQRAAIDNISEMIDVSDDPSTIDPHVRRLGPISIDDSAYAVRNLVTPCVIPHEQFGGWVMVALALEGETEARIVVLSSTDRQNWKVEGPLQLEGNAKLPTSRPFAPRIVRMDDVVTGEAKDVVVVTFPNESTPSRETAGYLVGTLEGNTLHVSTDFRPLDFGPDFTRPRIIQGESTVMFGLVGTHPQAVGVDSWANCLSAPRHLTLADGKLYQDIVGAPAAVRGFSDYGIIYTAQLDASKGKVVADLVNQDGKVVLTITYTANEISIARDGVNTVSAPLDDADSDTLAIFVDGPVCEVFADGGSATLTSTVLSEQPASAIEVKAHDGAKVIASMRTKGKEIQRRNAGLTSPEEQERFMREALLADRELATGVDEEL